MRISIEEKIDHLISLEIVGDFTEIRKMYAGEEFDCNDKLILNVKEKSRELCEEHNKLFEIPLGGLSAEMKEKINIRKSEIVNDLFPRHNGNIFACREEVTAIIGMVEVYDLVYINRKVQFGSDTITIIGNPETETSRVVLLANDVKIGKEIKGNKVSTTNIGDTVWLCAGVSVNGGLNIAEGAVVGLAADVENNTVENTLYVGVPARAVRELNDVNKTRSDNRNSRSEEEIDKIVNYLRGLGFDGDMTEYVKMLKGEDYNCLTDTLGQITDYTHSLCSEYNSGNLTQERKKEIIEILFPFHGTNFSVGDELFMDIIGSTFIGNNVTIGNNITLAGNIRIGNNVTIGDNCFLQCIGHDMHKDFRKIQMINNAPVFICTSGDIEVGDDVTIGNNCYIAPNSKVTENVLNNKIYVNGKMISKEEKSIEIEDGK